MASVSNVGNNSEITVHFDANIALQDTGDALRLIAGTQMQAVDSIEGIIAFDGSKGLAITADSPEHMTELTPGVYRFHIPMNEKTVNKGMIIAYFSKNSDISLPMSLTDTEFVSGGERYHLSNTVE